MFETARPDDKIWFDDGKIGGRVVETGAERVVVSITQAALGGSRLRAEKGINLPDTALKIPALTGKDFTDLAFLAPHVDMVGLSFVRSADDVRVLHAEMDRLDAPGLGVVLKIENRHAFENLPALLLAGLERPPVAVMVARGDLAVEVGFERLAEVQEEILWLCEAAHIPVVWATQVLESMAKTGRPSRAEVSDAVMSGRAECVMLNKGPYITEVARFLASVLERMEAHQSKRRTLLRRLAVSQERWRCADLIDHRTVVGLRDWFAAGACRIWPCTSCRLCQGRCPSTRPRYLPKQPLFAILISMVPL